MLFNRNLFSLRPLLLATLVVLALPSPLSHPALAQTAPATGTSAAPTSTAPTSVTPGARPPAAGTATPAAPAAEAKKFYTDGIPLSVGGGEPLIFVPTKMTYLSQAYIKLTGVDLTDNVLIDDFASVNFCSVLTQYYKDEFSWRQAREAIRASIIRNLENYPEYFYIVGKLPLGRYDFDKKAFVLDEKNQFRRTGQFRIDRNMNKCEPYTPSHLPMAYNIRLNNPITLTELEIPEEKAFELTREMDKMGNSARNAYAVFYIRMNDFSILSAITSGGAESFQANVRATLLSMRIYTDPFYKNMIYEYTGE